VVQKLLLLLVAASLWLGAGNIAILACSCFTTSWYVYQHRMVCGLLSGSWLVRKCV